MTEPNVIFKILFANSYQFFLELFFAMLVVGLNLKKRKYFWIVAPVCLALGFPLYFMPRIIFVGLDFSYIITFIIVFGLSILLYKEPINLVLVNVAIAFGIQHFTWNSMFVFFDLLPTANDLAQVWVLCIYFAFYLLFYITLFLWLFYKKYRTYPTKGNVFIYVVGGIILLITFFLSQRINEWNIYIRLYTALTAFLAVSLIFAYPYAIQKLEREKTLEQEKETLKKIIEHQARQNELYIENREYIKMKYHDMKHQLDYLASIENREDFLAYLEEIKRNVYIYDAYAQTGNTVVDVVLTQKSLMCTNKNIRFTYMVDGEALNIFTSTDLVSLFSNILDNAIEAADKEKDDYRLIKLNVRKNDNFLIITQMNYTINHPVSDGNGLLLTSKDDLSLHGYGLKSIKYIVQKYGGEVNIELDDSTFRIEIVIPLDK